MVSISEKEYLERIELVHLGKDKIWLTLPLKESSNQLPVVVITKSGLLMKLINFTERKVPLITPTLMEVQKLIKLEIEKLLTPQSVLMK
jgi:hypothetical protein